MQNLDEFYIHALNLYEKTFSHEELVEFLRMGNLVEKHYAALNLKTITSKEDAQVLVNNLTGVDGKVREATVLKFYEFISDEKYRMFFLDRKNYEKFAHAVVDIDSNVCRIIINSICFFLPDEEFSSYFAGKMKEFIFQALEEINAFTFRDKKYKINKQVFKIYWCLEALYYFYGYIDYEDLKTILIKCSELSEYTVREKCAALLTICPQDEDLQQVKNKLISDSNYYVRLVLNNV